MTKKAAKKKILSKSGGPAHTPTCTDCFALDCYRRDKKAPNFCLTDGAGAAQVASTKRIYAGKGSDGKVARAAAEIEGRYYGKLTRVEEIVAFARRIGARRIGIATCIGLVEEARIFTRVLEAKGFEWHSVLCKVGSVDKTAIGIPEALKDPSRSSRGRVQSHSAGQAARCTKDRSQRHHRAVRGTRCPVHQALAGLGDHPHYQGSRAGT